MDLTDINNMIGYADPIQLPVSELTAGTYIFNIPSYQRGYRWESDENPSNPSNDVKQVDDLLEDLTTFVTNNPGGGNYYLQPLMVKPHMDNSGKWVWDVLDGQQRLTTILLILKCLDEKLHTNASLQLFELSYERQSTLDFSRITFDISSPNYNYPDPSDNLDSYYIRKAKDRIGYWYDNVVNNAPALKRGLDALLFDPEPSRKQVNATKAPSNPLRAIFIWYNVEPALLGMIRTTTNRIHDIEVFNRLNRGKISLTDSELIKALFIVCLNVAGNSASSVMNKETLIRTWDEMERKFQNDELWLMFRPKNKSYSNRMDLLFDFIKDINGATGESSYRYFYKKMHTMTSTSDPVLLENLWDEVKYSFDKLCKWYEDTTCHNRIGFLVNCGETVASISNQMSTGISLNDQISNLLRKKQISVDEIESLNYKDDGDSIRMILLLFNVLTCDKYGQKFPFGLYRKNSYDIEHVNSQTDNPIERLDEKQEWIRKHAFPCLRDDALDKDSLGAPTPSAQLAIDLIFEGGTLLRYFKKNGQDKKPSLFVPYRIKVESYYAYGNPSQLPSEDKDSIGNLTLLNSAINREYKNALFPRKLRILKRSDQEGAYIPLCTKYMFLKYYSSIKSNVSAFNLMRWREKDQLDYVKAIKKTLNNIL